MITKDEERKMEPVENGDEREEIRKIRKIGRREKVSEERRKVKTGDDTGKER